MNERERLARSDARIQGGQPSDLKDGVPATAKGFRIRAWKEADTTRVVVFAVAIDANAPAPARERETQIATFLLSPGQSVTVDQTSRFNAAPVIVSAR